MRKSFISYAASLFALALTAVVLPAQSNVAAQPLRMFVDCNSMGCDLDYFRTEIPYVDYVRDRADATVHVLVSTQSTGSGGREYTMNFIGLREFAGVSDTLTYVSPQSATDDDLRKGIAQTLKLGFVRYIARTPAGNQLKVTYTKPAAAAAKAESKRDP